jgi:probable F420-dependent oxidoreductase
MELGVAAWATDFGVSIGSLAQTVEQAGLESLFLTEHTHVPASRRDLLEDSVHWQDSHILDPFTALGAAAVLTSRLKLGTGACIVAQRDPIILAKQVATVDHLSGGRMLFGVAPGWLIEEMRNHGVEPRRRWQLIREQIPAMKAIWTHDEAEFHGKFVDFDPIWLWPKPVQAPHPPVLIGGDGPLSLRTAAECGDGWMPVVLEATEFERQQAELQRLCEEAGRPPLGVTAVLGAPDEQLLTRCAELGVIRCLVAAPTTDLTALQSFLDEYSQVANRIGLPFV